ncbi:anti-sigma factor antagonist [Leptospira gomenensis]|uniref:Anti-sigma factor antagonist n=1 Tax=Leptospira gomenensis TaxID=2484974 RepID=A0A5F1YSH9_9LEPT|nr:STAS domain-containing protein [Leptospira gomenensis]TGK33184.1 anti-sigma factor antagonist [Leptospira gomenensis]TGK35582.1 anti-sigma factor antagonist [Leptospira gomenensis]TGK40906.1 anti-sigma factor antagonist [Leptospira gomenensis]TGK61196.1 anti-sigma factor antagonist [Leptospira gomenensis]
MEIRSRLTGNILKLKLKGRLDSGSAEDFYSYLKSKWEEGVRKFLFSCEELEYLEAEGISVLAKFENFLKNRGASSAYCAFNEECKTLLSFLGFGKRIAFFEDHHRAEEYLSLIKILDQRNSEIKTSPISKIKRNQPVQFYSSGPKDRSGSGGSHSIYIPEIQTLPDTEEIASKPPETKFSTGATSSENSAKESLLGSEIVSVAEVSSLSPEGILAKSERMSGEGYSAKSVLEKAIHEIHEEKNFPKRVIHCEACGTRVRVSKPGRYLCPACRIEFDLNAMGGVRYLEKLLGSP